MNICIKEFWAYFEKNNFAFMMLNELEPEVKNEKLNELNRLLEVFHPKLGYLFNLNRNNYQFIITAHGNPYLFKSVDLLVKYAPIVKDWSIKAFIPPSPDIDRYKNGTDKPFIYHGISLRISEMKYSIASNDNNPLLLSLNIYIKDFIVVGYNEHLTMAIYILLEHLLGEKSFVNEIHSVNITQLTHEVEQNPVAIPLHNLSEYIKISKKLSAEELL